MEHLEYDLIITNVFTAPVTLLSVAVIALDGRVLLRLADDALAANTEPIFFPMPDVAPTSPIPVGGVVAVVIDLIVLPGQGPARISHHLAYALPPDTPALSLLAGRTLTGPELAVDPRPPLVIAPPLRGDGWLDLNGCCQASSVHRSPRLVVDGARYIKNETFAIDWLRLQDRRLYTGDGAENEQYFAFGAEVVSVADGTVVSVRDAMPEEMPNQLPVAVKQAGDYLGNHVIVQLLPDVFAVYGLLQLGSITVQVGEQAATGQLLRRLGNSGNTTAPHLHFQLSDGPDLFTSSSLPFVFDRYTLGGTVEEDPSSPGQLRIVGTPQAQTGTYPLVLTVQDFP